jgi:heme-degrading monooxygenase HmoA
MAQVTTITFLKYAGFQKKYWALGMMGKAHGALRDIEGCTFYKLLGSGKGEKGFSVIPDFSTYALLQVWESRADAKRFFEEAEVMQQFKSQSVEQWTLFLQATRVHGLWSNNQPFFVEEKVPQNLPVAVITRATIHPSKLFSFWKYVPTSQHGLAKNEGLLFTKGIGELPIVQMATFSLWKNEEALHAFAYKSDAHKEAIKRTRKLGWYKEELFARFVVLDSVGTYQGKNPLQEFLPSEIL